MSNYARLARHFSHQAAAYSRKAIEISGAPPSIASIPDTGIVEDLAAQPGAFIRQVGCTRRVFLFQPYLTAAELEGLAYRIRTLTKNDGINSVLIATDNRDDADALPSSLVDLDFKYIREEEYFDMGLPPAPGQTWHVAAGYDPVELYASGRSKNPEQVEYLLSSLGQLALATRGDIAKSKVPVIAMPHGAVEDGGFCFLMGSYVIATKETTFRIKNPSRGLSLDPVGLSYLLPRLGKEFRQPSADYKGCGIIMGCMGFEADASDMMETGLATNYVESPVALGLLEQTLSEIPPWNQQTITKNLSRFHGDPEAVGDHNAEFRNVAVADAVHSFSAYRADGADMWIHNESGSFIGEDPSLDTDYMPWHEDRVSDLVNYAATFDKIFTKETTLEGILERFREIAATETKDPEVQEGIDVAADFCQRLEQQSPLAVSVVYRLLGMGAQEKETLKSCMEREIAVQAKLLTMPDYENWAAFSSKHADDDSLPAFTGWKHKSIADVTKDEVLELIGS
jgi:enoyl-CoA hydratase/carnithine racemase